MKYLKSLSCLIVFLCGVSAQAGMFELGGSYSWNRSNYNAGSFSRVRSYGLSLGYYFTQDSELQFSYSDSKSDTFVPGVQDTAYHDRVYSMNMLYHLFDEKDSFRPFFRIGVGQLNRDATGSYPASGYSAPGRLDQVSVIGGIGFKLKVTSQIALKSEATSYLTGGSIGSWQDNLSYSIGGAVYF